MIISPQQIINRAQTRLAIKYRHGPSSFELSRGKHPFEKLQPSKQIFQNEGAKFYCEKL